LAKRFLLIGLAPSTNLGNARFAGFLVPYHRQRRGDRVWTEQPGLSMQ
jgi:hypothetical protein